MARALLKAIPKGEERNAALTRLKDSDEVTPEACANAGWGDGGERGRRALHAAIVAAKLNDPLQRGK